VRAQKGNLMRPIMLLSLLTVLASCTAREQQPQNMELYCQLKSCVCRSTEVALFGGPEDQDVAWTDEGVAACPEGFALAPGQSKESLKSKFYKQQ